MDMDRLMAVLEPAETFEQVRSRSPALPLPLRVHIAAAVLNMMRYFSSGASPLGELVHCDIHHKQVAFVGRRTTRVVLLDLDSMQLAPLGKGEECTPGAANTECSDMCMYAPHYENFAGVAPDLLERRCKHGTRKCPGFDGAFNQWTMAGYLMYELLLRDDIEKQVAGLSAAEAAGATADVIDKERRFRNTILHIVNNAREADPADRGDPVEALQAIVDLAEDFHVPLPFKPVCAFLWILSVHQVANDNYAAVEERRFAWLGVAVRRRQAQRLSARRASGRYSQRQCSRGARCARASGEKRHKDS